MAELQPLLLTDAELGRFKIDGYIVREQALDPALCAQARDWFWR